MAYDPNNPTGSSGSPYDTLRSRARQQSDVAKNQGLEALQRRYAAMGNLNSGSYIAQQNQLNQKADEDLQNRLGDIGLSEQEGANQRNFQREMTQGAQAFQSKQAELARDFQAGQADKEMALKRELSKNELQQTMRKLDLEFQNSELERQAMQANMDMNNWQKQHSGGLLGAGGFLGTGIGSGGGTFFCTEIFKAGFATAGELLRMSRFFVSTIIPRTDAVLFYLKNGPKIVEAANKANLHWGEIKSKAIDVDLVALQSGKVSESHDLYYALTKDMCLKFRPDLWKESTGSIWARVIALPQVLVLRRCYGIAK